MKLTKTMWKAGLAVLAAVSLAACGGGGETELNAGDSTPDTDLAQSNSAEAATNPGSSPLTTGEPSGDPGIPVTDPAIAPPAEQYVTVYDPNALYGLDDINMSGSYLKLDLEGMTDDQMNRIIHRFRSEFCTCGCPKDPIDQCLVNDSACGTAITLANNIIREEKIK
jgi:hypothetical protein